MLTFHGRSSVKSVCGLMLCMLGLLAPVSAAGPKCNPDCRFRNEFCYRAEETRRRIGHTDTTGRLSDDL